MSVSLLRDDYFHMLPIGALFQSYEYPGEHEKIGLSTSRANGQTYLFRDEDTVRYCGRIARAPYEFTFVKLEVGEKFKHADFACELEKISMVEAMTAYGTVHPIASCSPVTR